MVFTKAFAIAAIFATLTAAAPVHQKRAVVYETVTEVDVTTIDTTITVYPGEPTPTVASVYTTEVTVTSTTPAVVPTSTVAPAPAPVAETSTSPTQAPPAPQTTTTAAPVPTTTVAPPAPAITTTSSSSTSTAPPATSTATSGSSGSGPSGTGDGTFYDTATSLSAPSYCGTANDGTTENVVALSQAIMNQSLCGASITVTYDGKTVTGTVVDKCMGCNSGSIDMSRAMFGDLASLDAGRITVSWSI